MIGQAGTRRALAWADAALNRFYGWRLNPLYHSGVITVALFVVLLITGLYLVFVYRLAAPYDSVARLADQPWLGGWIRSLHRYASDAAVIAALVHALRMFAHNRTWGPRVLAWTSAILALLLALRTFLAPDWHEPPAAALQAEDLDALRPLIAPGLQDRPSLAAQVSSKRFLLVGETHFQQETVAYFTGLLDDLDDDSLVLLLELPGSTQPAIDRYLASGDEREFDAIWGKVEALPLHDILRWAHAHRTRVLGVVAMDEDRTRIFINRALLDDTRNQTMARAMLDASQAHPGARIVAYAGATVVDVREHTE